MVDGLGNERNRHGFIHCVSEGTAIPQGRKERARGTLSAAWRRRVDVDVRRGPNAASHVASSIGKSIRDVRVPQIFHGEKYVGGSVHRRDTFPYKGSAKEKLSRISAADSVRKSSTRK